jgi:hypothetical protein
LPAEEEAMRTETVLRTAVVHAEADVAYRTLLDLDVRTVAGPLLAAAGRQSGWAPAASPMRLGDLPATPPGPGSPLVRLGGRPGREIAFGAADSLIAARVAAVPAAEGRCVLVFEMRTPPRRCWLLVRPFAAHRMSAVLSAARSTAERTDARVSVPFAAR